MSNPKFLGVDLSIPTYTWSGGVDASYPVSNLKNAFPDIYSKSNILTKDQYLTIDFGTAVSCNCAALDGANLVAAAADIGVRLQYNTNDDTNWADAVTVDTFQYTDATQQLAFNAVSKRYWRIIYNSTVDLVAKPYIGSIYLGTSLDFEKTQQWGCVVQMPSHNVATSEALDGRIRSAITAGGRYNWEIEFKLQSDTFMTAWRAFLLTVKNSGTPFYYIDSNGSVWCVVFDSAYNPMSMFRYNLNDTAKFKLKTVLANY
jgi:hypothetical protein